MICIECSVKNQKDAKYCKNCGKKLEERENEFNSVISIFLNNLKGIFLKPIDTIKNFINKNDYQNGIIYLFLNIVIFSILMLLLFNFSSNNLYSLFNYSDYFIDFNGMYYFRIFLLSIIIYLLTYVVFGGIYYLVNTYLFKNNTDIKKIVSWLGINSIFTTISYILFIISFIISFKLAITVLLMTIIIYAYNLFSSAKYLNKLDENKVGYVLTITIIITLFIVIYILPQLFI